MEIFKRPAPRELVDPFVAVCAEEGWDSFEYLIGIQQGNDCQGRKLEHKGSGKRGGDHDAPDADHVERHIVFDVAAADDTDVDGHLIGHGNIIYCNWFDKLEFGESVFVLHWHINRKHLFPFLYQTV